jgi:eukaryotic-like serine/threonine-protein kinase
LGDERARGFSCGLGPLMIQPESHSVAGVNEGDVLAGKYRVERILGIGGMGVVVAAHHLQLDEKVALKFLLPQSLADTDAVARFLREARAAVKIKNEHVARVIDVGTLPNGAPYMVMEYLDGGDLAAWLKQRGPLPIEQAVEFVLQACVAVADAHALGIVHRDLKPANLFCVRRSDGQLSIKVLDFGISKLASIAGAGPSLAMTKTASMMGSPLYMSPEQMRSSKDVDAQTDIWALGVILFELISGRPPFQGDSITELAIKINNEAAPPIQSVRPDVPGELQTIVSKCLEKDRRRRYRNVAELALALVPFAPKRAQGTVDRISGIIHASGLSTSTLTAPPFGQPSNTRLSTGTLPAMGRTTAGSYAHKPARGKAVAGGLLAGAVLLVAIVFSILAWRRRSAPDEMAQTPAAVSSSVPSQQPAREAAAADVNPTVTSLPVLMPTAAQSATLATPPATNTPPTLKKKFVPPVSSTPVAAPATSPSAPAVKCDPPYYFDAKGNRIFKKECL